MYDSEERARVIRWFSDPLNYARYPGHVISSGNLYTGGIYDCCSVALFGKRFHALSHYNRSSGADPSKYVPRLVQSLKNKGEDSLLAFVVAGEKSHLGAIKRNLNARQIPLIGEYDDRFGPNSGGCKSVAIDAENRRAIVLSGIRIQTVLAF